FRETQLESAAKVANFLFAKKLADNQELLARQKRVVELGRGLATETGATPLDHAKLAEAERRYGVALLEVNLASEARPVLEEAVALQLRYAEASMRKLREAVQRGFKDVAAIKEKPVFGPLQERQDFKELMNKIEKGS